ncbi:MAG: exonuclease SbcCD subunit D [Candidatus Nanopelagicales bacterium]|jgi:exonuclease SbcD|nr:exonuclease SbcCD subunit D [Candidatus Nanopelagicales bacterium]
MRFLHTSDWHLGRRLHGAELLADQEVFLAWLLELAVSEQVDAVLVSGDVYDRAQPGADAISLMDRTVAGFARARIPLVISSGNHDSAVRLQYAGEVLAEAGIHLRTSIEQVAEPVLLSDGAGQVGVYGIPFVLPDAVVAQLEVERSHAAVLDALAGRIRTDASARGLDRVVVMAHAFVTGGSACESEREIRVGGVGDTPAEVFDGVTYVALGHLHGPQVVRLAGSSTAVEYSGSPLAFSFSERDHTKSVTVVDIDGAGGVSTSRVPTPVPRPLVQVSGRLDDLLDRARGDLAGLADAWVKVVLTDPGRVANPMEQLRAHWPHTLVLEFAPERDDVSLGLTRLTEASDPVEICAEFVRTVSGDVPSPLQRSILAEVVLGSQRAEASA